MENISMPVVREIKKLSLEDAKKLNCPLVALMERFIAVPILNPAEAQKKNGLFIPEHLKVEMGRNTLIQAYVLSVGPRVEGGEPFMAAGDIIWVYPYFAQGDIITIKNVEYHIGMQNVPGVKMK